MFIYNLGNSRTNSDGPSRGCPLTRASIVVLYNRPLYAFFSALFPPNKTFPWKDLWVAEFYLLNVR